MSEKMNVTATPNLLMSIPTLQFFATPLNTSTSVQTGTGANSTKPNAYYDKLLLELLVQTDYHHSKFAQNRDMPTRTGDTINFRKIVKLEPSLEPLTEGVTPEGQTGQVEAISAVTKQYGDWMAFTDLVDVTVVDPIIKEYTVELARTARETLDLLVREELNGGANVFYAGGATSRAAVAADGTGKPTINDFRRIVLAMKKANVKPAAGGKYVALITPDVAFDLLDDPKFEKAYDIASNANPFIKGEVADLYGIKFIEVQNAKVFEAGEDGNHATNDVHSSIVLGERPYGITKIKGNGDVQTVVKPLGSAGTADPLNQRQSIGWKVNAFAVKRLYEEAICRYESIPTSAE